MGWVAFYPATLKFPCSMISVKTMTPNPSNSPNPPPRPHRDARPVHVAIKSVVFGRKIKKIYALRSMLLKIFIVVLLGDNSERLYMTFVFFKSLPINVASLMLGTQQFHNFLADILIVLVRSFWKDSATKALGERSGRYTWPFSSCFTGQ